MTTPTSEAYHAMVQLIDNAYSGDENRRAMKKLSELFKLTSADARREAFEEVIRVAGTFENMHRTGETGRAVYKMAEALRALAEDK